MKKLFSLAIMVLVAVVSASAYETVTVKDSITGNATWTAGKQYLLKGYVYVVDGATLTIEKGTIIRGDKSTKGALIVERGGKLISNGTFDEPVIFTSNQPQGSRSYGDWGGIILCGKAPVNWTAGQAQVEGGPRSFYGGTDANDNSGKIVYTRIEFGGIAFSPNNEVNGLTLCGVGAGTELHHIQVTLSGDDAFEWFGGTVSAKYLVSHRNWDDDFDSDNGWNGNVQFGVVLRDPYAADISGSKAIETDSYLAGTIDGKTNNNNATKAVFSNCTFIGPLVNPTSTSYDLQHTAGVHIRRGSSLSLLNSVVAGFTCGILIDESSSSYGSTTKNIGSNDLVLKSNVVAGILMTGFPQGTSPNKNIMYVKDGARSLTPTTANADSATTGNCDWAPYAGPYTMFGASANGNFQYTFNPSNPAATTFQSTVRIQDPFNLTNPNFFPMSVSPIVYNSKTLPSYIPTGTFPGNVYPFDPNKAINTDTSNLFVNYNAPTILPNFTDAKVSGSFFDKTNYVGAFDGKGTNWMLGWTNFDPNNTNYEYVVGINEIKTNIEAAVVYPNPAVKGAEVKMTLTNTTNLNITVVDMTGRKVQDVAVANNINGTHTFAINTEALTSGMYFVNITTSEAQKSIKLSVIK